MYLLSHFMLFMFLSNHCLCEVVVNLMFHFDLVFVQITRWKYRRNQTIRIRVEV